MKGAAAVVPTILEALKNDPEAAVQGTAILALGNLGPEAKAAVPELTKRARDPKYPWATEALKALRQIAPRGPAVVFTDCRRERDAAFSRHERDMIAAARRHLELAEKRAIDAYYRVTRTDFGYEVFVVYVTGYDDGQPVFIPGRHCTVQLRDDGSVIKVMPGR
jgi:hypothetical protein